MRLLSFITDDENNIEYAIPAARASRRAEKAGGLPDTA
jgi:hypothetical protein